MVRLNNELREFSRHLQYIRETEKNKIAKEVHDELGQGLAAIKFDVSWLKKHLGDDRELIYVDLGKHALKDKVLETFDVYVFDSLHLASKLPSPAGRVVFSDRSGTNTTPKAHQLDDLLNGTIKITASRVLFTALGLPTIDTILSEMIVKMMESTQS